MQYDYSLGIIGNFNKLFKERNYQNGQLKNTQGTVEENQIMSDEAILDHEERIILLEVGE